MTNDFYDTDAFRSVESNDSIEYQNKINESKGNNVNTKDIDITTIVNTVELNSKKTIKRSMEYFDGDEDFSGTVEREEFARRVIEHTAFESSVGILKKYPGIFDDQIPEFCKMLENTLRQWYEVNDKFMPEYDEAEEISMSFLKM